MSPERGEHDPALMRLVLVLKQETEHAPNLAPDAVSDIGRHPDPAP
jgi:hypothetical protein